MAVTENSLPSGVRLALVVCFACIVLFLQALDSTIISTALPSITDEFQSSQDTGWYASAYMLTMCAFQIFWGRLYTFYNLKYTYIVSIVIFEAGSLLCGVAPNSRSFIGGRALAGVGAGGVFAGSFVSVAFSVPLQKRPMYSSYLGTVYGVASVIGPPLGGALTSNVTWRWCFYINLPLGGIVLAGLIFCYQCPQASARLVALPWKEKLRRLDLAGSVLLIVSISCLILALQWGGGTYAWSNARIIVLFLVCAVIFACWVGWQIYLGDSATVPKRIVSQRSMPFTMFYSFTQGGVNFGVIYFAPIWFQGVKGYDAAQSGLDLLPFVIGLTITMLAVGQILTKWGGYSAPFMLVTVVMVTTATGLFTLWRPDSSNVTVLGCLALFGLGQGFGWQQPILIAQTMLPAVDIPTGTSMTTICKLLGGTIFVSVSETVFNSTMRQQIIQRLPQLDVDALLQLGITELRSHVDKSLWPQIAEAYNASLRPVWIVYIGLSAASLLGVLGVERRNVTDKVAHTSPLTDKKAQAPIENYPPSSSKDLVKDSPDTRKSMSIEPLA